MAELTRMTRTALEAATKSKSKDENPMSDPKKLAATGIGLAVLPLAVEQIAKRVVPKVSDLGGQAKEKVSDAASGAASAIGDQAKQAAKGAVASKLPGISSDEGDEGGGVLSKLKPGSSSSDEGDDEGRAAPGQGGSG